MYLRALLLWLLLMVLAIANGGFREALLTPRLGAPAAHVVSTLLLCLLIAVTSYTTIPWLAPPTPSAALALGTLWLVLTLAFEFGFGHYVVHKPWSELLADYNLLAGRVWILVPVTVFLAPLLAARTRDLL